MPDLAMHYYYGQDVLKSLPSEIPIDPDVFCFTLSGPDDWFFYFTDVRKCTRGSYMHRYRTGEFLHGLAKQPVLLSYFAGYFCHQVLPAMRELRNAADHCEILVGKEYWPLPNYSEMLFYV